MRANSGQIWKIWLCLIPIFALAAWPAIKWARKAGSSDVPLSKEAYSVFNAEQGEIAKNRKTGHSHPDLADGEFSIHYRSAREKDEAREADAKRAARAREEGAARSKPDAPLPRDGSRPGPGNAGAAADEAKAKAQETSGLTKGYLGYLMGQAINNPKAVAAILNNKYVIKGFMSRAAVKAATASPQALADFLKDGGAISNFMNNGAVQNALDNPQILGIATSSGFAAALLDTPAGRSLLNDPQAAADLIAANPQLAALMSDPKIMAILMSNPDAAAYLGRMNLGGGK